MKNSKNVFNSLLPEEKRILSLIQLSKIVSKEELMMQTGIKSTSLNRILETLKENNLIEKSGEGESTGGRKPALYSLVKSNRIFGIGINISLLHLDFAILNYSGEIILSYEIPISKHISPSEAVEKLLSKLDESLAEHNILKEEIITGCVCVFCAIDSEKGLILKSLSTTFTHPQWINYPIRTTLEEALGVPMVIDTTANTGCVGEYLFGHGKNINNLSSFICGNSIRMGTISQGVLIRPNNNMDDAFGHMVINAGGEKCLCGNYGCIDCYTTVPVIIKNFLAEIKLGRPSSLSHINDEKITIEDILKAGEEGDQLAVEVIIRAATVLGTGIANYANLFSPDMIVLAGVLIEKSNVYFNTVQEVVHRKMAYLRKSNNLIFKKRSNYGKAVFGAAIVSIEKLFDNKY